MNLFIFENFHLLYQQKFQYNNSKYLLQTIKTF